MSESYHMVKLDKNYWHKLPAMMEWCSNNFGEGGHNSLGDAWSLETAFGNSYFGFKYERDATLFSMKWL